MTLNTISSWSFHVTGRRGRSLARRLVVGLALLVAASCASNGGSPTAPSGSSGTDGGGGNGGSAGTALTATIDGQPWTATTASLTVSYSNGILAIVGSDASGVTSFGFGFLPTGSTAFPYTVALDTGANAVLSILTAAGTVDQWSATHLDGGTGTITVTGFTDHSATGTFTFTLVAAGGGASGTKTVTQGSFSVTF